MWRSSWAPEWIPKVWGNWVTTDIENTVWAIQKTSQDLSLFHGMFTYNIPKSQWHIEEDWVEIPDNDTSTDVISLDGGLSISSWATLWDTRRLRSRRHPRYQPNRWHYYAVAWHIINKDAIWIREWGLNSNGNSVMFRLRDGVLYAVVENSEGVNREEAITLPAWLDIEGWTLYDIQFQWRGAWDYFFFINQKLVHTVKFLWTWTNVSISNPAMSAHYYAENTDWTEVEIRFGCVDVSSEWGKKEGTTYADATNVLTWTSAWRTISGRDQPLLIIRVKDVLGWKQVTRDSIVNNMIASSDNKSIGKLWYTRDPTAFWGTLYWPWLYQDCEPWSSLEFIDCVGLTATEITFNSPKAVQRASWRVPQDNSYFEDISKDSDFFIEQNDYIVLTWERENAGTCTMFWSVVFWEEI